MALTLAFAEARDGKLRRSSLETVSEARRLAGLLGAQVEAVVVGPGTEALAGELAAYGADRVRVFDDAALAAYATEPYARALAQTIAETKPSVVLVPFTAMGKDLAPRVAARLRAGLASDCTHVEKSGDGWRFRRPVYSGKAIATVAITGSRPAMATLRPNVFALPASPERRRPPLLARCPMSKKRTSTVIPPAVPVYVPLTRPFAPIAAQLSKLMVSIVVPGSTWPMYACGSMTRNKPDSSRSRRSTRVNSIASSLRAKPPWAASSGTAIGMRVAPGPTISPRTTTWC